MRIYVQHLIKVSDGFILGDKLSVDYSHEDTIETLKLKIQAKIGITSTFNLIFGGRILQPDVVLSSYCIQKDFVLQLITDKSLSSKESVNKN